MVFLKFSNYSVDFFYYHIIFGITIHAFEKSMISLIGREEYVLTNEERIVDK